METNTRQSLAKGRRSIAHRAALKLVSNVIDLTGSDMDSPVARTSVSVGNISRKRSNQFKEMEAEDMIRNAEEFICSSCCELIDVYGGLRIRNCLHEICIICARNVILESETINVKCSIFKCNLYFQDIEVRSLLTQEEYSKYSNQHKNIYKELIDLEEQAGVIKTISIFECEICCLEIEIGDGITIRECLHQFCIDCVRSTIISSEDAEVKCPDASCEEMIGNTEIRALLTQTEFDKFLIMTLRIAESRAPNSFHCKEANCLGWAICEDDVSLFICPICSSYNCISCQAIHTGVNCLKYQQNLRHKKDQQLTDAKVDEIIKNNLGMRCPTCKIIIMKRDGCDWLRCPMCKTEICWATKMRRWGPGGYGDTSDGCRCSIAKKCHPLCRNCH